MKIKKLTAFNFESEPIWMVLFPLAMCVLGVLAFLLAVLLRKLNA